MNQSVETRIAQREGGVSEDAVERGAKAMWLHYVAENTASVHEADWNAVEKTSKNLWRGYVRAALAANPQVERMREALERLVAKVDALPVEDMVHVEPDGSPTLLGYAMQAQGEWDDVKRAANDARTAIEGGLDE
ncbi:hypothetical protein WJS89_10365 [Sphingomicrobium sp. XHP0235]|uniref:hypothetical protein n=1 Tax=Sphingomicrobium aquimarinum TaxID=3133971 RepID=UPI0031FE9C12